MFIHFAPQFKENPCDKWKMKSSLKSHRPEISHGRDLGFFYSADPSQSLDRLEKGDEHEIHCPTAVCKRLCDSVQTQTSSNFLLLKGKE